MHRQLFNSQVTEGIPEEPTLKSMVSSPVHSRKTQSVYALAILWYFLANTCMVWSSMIGPLYMPWQINSGPINLVK